MVLTPSWHSLYVIDTMKRMGSMSVKSDDWRFSLHSGLGDLEGGDCEDRAVAILELLLSMKKATFTDPRLLKIQSLVRRCTPLFSIGVILLRPGSYTYHAFVMLIDSRLVNHWVVSHSTTPYPADDTKDLIPSALLEGTNSSTSCWSYNDGTQSVKEYEAGHLMEPVEANTPVPRSVIKSKKIYQHLVFASSPDLYVDHNILRLEFIQDGKEGAAINDVMGVPGAVFPFSTRAVTYDSKWFDLSVFTQCMPRLFSLADTAKGKSVGIIDIKTEVSAGADENRINTEKPAFDLCYRGADWNILLKERVRVYTQAVIVQIATIQFQDNGVGVRVRIWK
jgi:hypothetical protein